MLVEAMTNDSCVICSLVSCFLGKRLVWSFLLRSLSLNLLSTDVEPCFQWRLSCPFLRLKEDIQGHSPCLTLHVCHNCLHWGGLGVNGSAYMLLSHTGRVCA